MWISLPPMTDWMRRTSGPALIRLRRKSNDGSAPREFQENVCFVGGRAVIGYAGDPLGPMCGLSENGRMDMEMEMTCCWNSKILFPISCNEFEALVPCKRDKPE
ncbi:uncharacterized protein LOC132299386 [Cornus florida]|uniref:uncharacterized protein LOC132299386 n=1 Tax=Cornus florida TaxID=4283 RepID=UPI00289C7814|nr:uncharacterized protein LOC132299386 [Cornus florida]